MRVGNVQHFNHCSQYEKEKNESWQNRSLKKRVLKKKALNVKKVFEYVCACFNFAKRTVLDLAKLTCDTSSTARPVQLHKARNQVETTFWFCREDFSRKV